MTKLNSRFALEHRYPNTPPSTPKPPPQQPPTSPSSRGRHEGRRGSRRSCASIDLDAAMDELLDLDAACEQVVEGVCEYGYARFGQALQRRSQDKTS